MSVRDHRNGVAPGVSSDGFAKLLCKSPDRDTWTDAAGTADVGLHNVERSRL